MADDRRRDDDRLADEVLGINDGPVNKDTTDMPFVPRDDDEESAATRRRRADDLAEGRPDADAGPGGPDGMKVKI